MCEQERRSDGGLSQNFKFMEEILSQKRKLLDGWMIPEVLSLDSYEDGIAVDRLKDDSAVGQMNSQGAYISFVL